MNTGTTSPTEMNTADTSPADPAHPQSELSQSAPSPGTTPTPEPPTAPSIRSCRVTHSTPGTTPTPEPPTAPTGRDRIATVPNLISVARVLCIPWFLWLLFGAENHWHAALLLGTLGATDWVDGWWARTFNAVSELGKLLDPISDRVVFMVSILAIGIARAVPWWLVVAILVRDVLISLASIALHIAGAEKIDVIWWGKCATFGLYFAIPLLLAGNSQESFAHVLRTAGWLCVVPSLILSYFSAVLYIPIGTRAIRERESPSKQNSTTD